MRRILAIVLAAACGGTASIQATQEIKDGAGQAQTGMQSSNSGALAAVGLENICSALVSGVNPSALDMSGLPDPLSLAKKASAPPRHVQGALAPGRSTAATALVIGCIKPDPDAATGGVFVQAGQPGCDASDHLEVDYVNGDQLNVVYTTSSNAFDLKASVAAGAWSGTSLDFSATAPSGHDAATIHIAGPMKYTGVLDTDFDFNYQISQSADAAGFASQLVVNGSATDHASSVHLTFGWTTIIQLDGHNQLAAIEWDGDQAIDLLDGAGAVKNSVKWSGVRVRASLQPNAAGPGFTVTGFTSSGDLLWNGARTGSVANKDAGSVVIRWTDGTESALDPLALFGSPLT